MTTLYTNLHCTSQSQWFIILDKNNLAKVSHHYLTLGRYQVCLQPMQYELIDMHWAKCKQSNSHTSLTTLCSHFLMSYSNQAMSKSAHWWSWSCDIAWVIWRDVFLWKYPEGHQETHKVHFFHIKKWVGEMVIMNDVEWPMISYCVIYYEKFRKVMQRTEKEALMTEVQWEGKGDNYQFVWLYKKQTSKANRGVTSK